MAELCDSASTCGGRGGLECCPAPPPASYRGMLEMTPEEKFLFDLQGFIVVPGFLTPAEVGRLNEAIDANHDRVVVDGNANIGGSKSLAGSGKRMTMAGLLNLPHPWCEPFRALLAHPKLLPYLNTLLGRGWKLDHGPQIFMAEEGAE